ncbi:MAG TPA: helix-turn-helix domain-containing protein [Ktedonobacteraceae bacterium]|nr:helix-turn-helix domain-containing protein [Ktedonobacteraceae bacterium]
MRKRNGSTSTPAQPVAPIQLLTIPEVARRLSIGRTKVYGLIKNDGLPAVTVGSAMRIAEPSLQKWIQEHERVS